MKVYFSPYEVLWNGGGLSGMEFYPDPDANPETTETIDYVKAKKDIRTLYAHCVSGEVYVMSEDKEYCWEVTAEKEAKVPSQPKVKGRG